MYRRSIQNRLLEALSDTPVVFLRGARQSGKSTLVQMLAEGPYPARYLTLDNAGVLAAAGADAAGFIAGLEKPVIIDEVQRVPDLLLAIKEDVDLHRNAGRYILTGSADILTVPKVADALAGRMELLTLWPLSVAEVIGENKNLIDLLFQKGFTQQVHQNSQFNLFKNMLSGGFPEPFQRKNQRRRNAWFDSYVSTILDRDIRDLMHVQDLTALPRLLALLAARVGTLKNQSEISRSSGIPNSTLSRYLGVLISTFLVKEIPAWSANLGKRLVKAPKLFMVDTGLACSILGLDDKGLEKGREIAGRIFENFVVLEFMKYAAWSETSVKLYHFRSQQGQEVDLVIEDSRGRIIGIEVKLSATPSPKDFSALKALQKLLGNRFFRGVLVYTGKEIIPFGKKMHAVPVQSLY